MIDKPLKQIVETDIRGLIGGPETRTLDFKEWLPGETKPGGRHSKTPGADYAGDVAALANTEGGDLVFGISERETDDGPRLGRAARVIGLAVDESGHDQLESTLDQWLGQELDPRFRGVAYHWVPLADGRWVLVARVGRSFNAPHMVRGTSKFMYRTNRTNEPMNADQIRSAFLAADALPERMERFRDERLKRIARGEGLPFGMVAGATIGLHLIPVSSLDRSTRADLGGLQGLGRDWRLMPPSTQPARDARYNFEGFAVGSGQLPTGGHESYIQIFRNGTIEAVAAAWLGAPLQYGRTFFPTEVEQKIVDRLIRYMSAMRHIVMKPPAYISLSLVRAMGYAIATQADRTLGSADAIKHDPLPLPECYWAGGEAKADAELAPEILRPAFDALWQCGGLERSSSYLEGGRWSSDGESPYDFSQRTEW